VSGWCVKAEHIIGQFGDGFYKPDDPTDSVKTLKEASWPSRSDFSSTRTILFHYVLALTAEINVYFAADVVLMFTVC